MRLKLPFRLPTKKPKETVKKCVAENGRLSVMCGGCEHPNDIGSRECVVCICSLISENGAPERIVLRTGRDTEYNGEAVSLLNRLSEVDRLGKAMCTERSTSKKCAICSRSPSKLIRGAWSGFPEPDIDAVRSTLNGFDPSDETCNECVMRTYRSLDQIEYDLNEIRRTAAMAAFSLTEV